VQARLVWSSFDMTGPPQRSHRSQQSPSEKGPATMKLTTTTNVSVDGVMQAGCSTNTGVACVSREGLAADEQQKRHSAAPVAWAA
jgi:hypothetical protein